MALRSQRVALVVMMLAWPCIAISVADDKAATRPAKAEELVFSHEDHAAELDIAECTTCHQVAKVEKRSPAPTSRSHAPCLASGCHVEQFLSTGPRAMKEAPADYAKATKFCGICHASKSGAPPSRFAKAKANALYQSKTGANYHVEMNHLKHTTRTSCSDCHTVDPQSFQLDEVGPGHKECSSCHDSEHEVPMTECAQCHTSPGPLQYFTKIRKPSDVRSCGENSDGNRPCFKHERTEHRFSKKAPLECSSCHFMFKKKSHSGHNYRTLADVKSAPMMDNARDLAHKNCGAAGCHKRDVDSSTGKAKCDQCHSKKFMSNSLFD